MAATTKMDGDLDIDVGRLFGSLWRKKFRLLLTATVLTSLVGTSLLFVSPKYKSEARILIEQGESNYTRQPGASGEDTRTNFDPEAIASEVQIVTSADVLKIVLADEELNKNPEFKAISDLSLFENLMTLINRGPQVTGTDLAVMKLREKLNVYKSEQSRVIVVEFASKDPQLAASVPNAIGRAYVESKKEAKNTNDGKSVELLKRSLEKLEKSLPLAEAAVAQYRAQNDILIGQNNSVLATQQLSELSSELTRVRGVKANASSRAANVKALIASGASIESIPEVLSSGLMQRLRERQVSLKSDLAELSITLLDGHPQIKAVRSQIADLDGQIRAEVQKVLRSLETESQAAAIREKELSDQLNGLKAESSRVGEDEVELRGLEREVIQQRELLASYKERYREAVDRQAEGFQPVDARVFQKADVPGEAYFPKLIPSMIAAFVGSLLLLSVITLLRELFSGRAFRAAAIPADAMPPASVQTATDMAQNSAPQAVQHASSNPILDAPQAENVSVETPAQSTTSVAAVAARLIDDGESCVVIVSPEGNPACASSVLLARELSDQGLRVLLLDLTGNSAAARPMLDGLALPGITNLLAGEAAIAGIIHTDSYSEASVIPTGTADTAKAAAAVARLPMIINSLMSAFDMVLVECGVATPAGIQRLVMPGSGLLVSFIDADSESFLKSITELMSAGYEDISLVTPVGGGSKKPLPDRTAA